MLKIVINGCYGGFGLSKEAKEALGVKYDRKVDRTDTRLVALVEKYSEAASGPHAELRVVEIPDGVEWTIEEYDGREWVAEAHRTWE